MAAAAADGLRTGGILPTLKHFPGHGDTAEDSHTALAVTYKTLDELQACELLPFAADTGLHAVMVGHIAAPNVTGDGTPATLSPQLVALIPGRGKHPHRHRLAGDGCHHRRLHPRRGRRAGPSGGL